MRSSRCVGRCALLLMGAACVAVVAVYGELSAQALVAVAGAGVVLSAVGLIRSAGAAADPVGWSGLPWLVWVGAATACELLTLTVGAWPTLSDLLDPALAHPALRGAATAGWLAAGAWLVTRPAGRVPGES